MSNLKWTKHANYASTVWTVKWKDGVDASGALQTTKNDVGKAAAEAKIKSWNGIVQTGESRPTPI